MGINGLNAFLKLKCPSVFTRIKFTDIMNKRVAIDANNWMHVNMYFANSSVSKNLTTDFEQENNRPIVIKNWLDMCLSFSRSWLEYKIVPIFVFDGAYPEEKSGTHSSRQDRKTKIRNEISLLKTQLTSFSTSAADPNLKSKEEITARLKSLLGQDTTVNKDDSKILMDVLKNIGIPVITAPGEAEKHCAYLNKHGYCDYVFTSDSDALCFGAENLINKIIKENNETFLQTVRIKDVLTHLDISFETFIDLCIMSGCDYNTNMKGVAVGTSYKLLKQCKKIENLDKKYDVSCLKHETCRNLFKHENIVVDIDTLLLNREIFVTKGRDTLKSLGLEFHMNRLIPILTGKLDLLEI